MISIKISVDQRLASKMKTATKTFTKPRVLLGTGIIALVLPLSLMAAPVSIPNEFSANTPASAAEVNSNFDALKDAVNDVDARVTALANARHLPSQLGLHAYVTTRRVGSTQVISSSYNSTGGSVSFSTGGNGYSAVFAGINCVEAGTAVGYASTAPYSGSTALACRIESIQQNGSDCIISANCFDNLGNRRDEEVAIEYRR